MRLKRFGNGAALRSLVLALALLSSMPLHCAAQAGAWKPAKPVELVIGVSPGGGIDRVARVIQRIAQERRLTDVPISVANKPGGGGALALTYLQQHAGDAHYLQITATSLLTNHIAGKSQFSHRDFTPVVLLSDEYIGFLVKEDSPLRSGRDLLNAFRSGADSLAIGIATAAGNTNHIAAALAARSAGTEVKKLKVVVFGSGGEAMTALLGGHVGLVTTPVANSLAHVQAGRIRVLAVAAPQRFEGPLAAVPTWKEQGADVVVANWRPVIGAKGLAAPQVAYWEGAFGKLTQTEEWKNEVARDGSVAHFMGSRELAAYFDSQYAQFKSILTDLGLAK
jgi:putative tricarboxylic transport membrane protein